MTYQIIIIILLVFNILLGVDAWWLAKQCNKADKRVKELEKELEKEKASNKFVMPVAEIKAEFSEEDMKKIKELLINTKSGDVKFEEPTEETKCECNHIYNKIFLEDDVKHCSQRLVFRCAYCYHETIVPIERGLMNNLLRPF